MGCLFEAGALPCNHANDRTAVRPFGHRRKITQPNENAKFLLQSHPGNGGVPITDDTEDRSIVPWEESPLGIAAGFSAAQDKTQKVSATSSTTSIRYSWVQDKLFSMVTLTRLLALA